ncbi:hypothetical protein [Pseudomonas benzenivorans]|uniref:Uncharacterized protein n=1 Tax=Pseudomonas benzenivorans TaxID=556533 RepID=A0ABY5H8I3_9PSED|nr:hypothetical protein [Pseudomonas benzenivorans]UTW08638.1 hypothetical protein KDW96_04765 [Pseudomonas benzenivorans]
MTKTKGEVVHLYQRDPQAALERLNRITGLSFARWPESLLQSSTADAQAVQQTNELTARLGA